jgi:hypothetical protein
VTTGERIALRQQRDLSQMIEGAAGLYLQNFWPLFSIAAVVIPLGIAVSVLEATIDNAIALAVVVVTLALAQGAVNLLASAALITALFDIDSGKPAEFSHAYDVAFERFWTLVGAVLRAAFHILLFAVTIIGIPWAIQRSVRWMFLEQAVILDQTSARAALAYSADAVIGSWWRTFGISIVLSIIVAVPSTIISLLLLLAPVVVSATANAAVNAVLLPFAVTAMTLLYLDLKTRKESDVTYSPA